MMNSRGFILDLDTCIDVLRRVPAVREAFDNEGPDTCAISSVTWYELTVGSLKGVSEKGRQRLAVFGEVVTVADFGKEQATQASIVEVDLRKRGLAIGSYNTLIAGHALSLGFTLVTNNLREYTRVPGLDCVSWR